MAEQQIRPSQIARSYALLQDQKAQNTAGGGFTSGSWQTRVLNTEVIDSDGIVSLSANQFTLQKGTYRIYARSPVYEVNRHQARIQNVTDNTTAIWGASGYNGSGDATQTESVVVGEFTITAQKSFQLEHRCQTTRATDGLGIEGNFGTEVYASVEIWKVA